MLAPICTKCKNAVDVPEDYSAGTIRCGICWAEVTLPPRSAPVTTATMLDEPAACEPSGDPFEHLPGRPAKGMAPLEDLLRNIVTRQPALFTAPPAPELKSGPTLATVKPRKIVQQESEAGLRRQRGAGTSVEHEKEESPPAGSNTTTILLLLLIAVAVFIAGYFLMR